MNGKLQPKMFYNCNNLKQITIQYENIKELMKNFKNMFLIQLKEDIKYLFLHKGDFFLYFTNTKSLIIFFKGPKLSRVEKRKLSFILKYFHISKFEFQTSELLSLPEQQQLQLDYGEEINNLLLQLNELINKLPNNIQEEICQIKELLLTQYQNNKEKEVPKLNFNLDTKITLNSENHEIGNAKKTLLLQLHQLTLSLNHQQSLITFVQNIEKYNKILDTKIDNLKENPQTIEDYLQNLTFISLRLSKQRKEELKSQINEYLEKPKKELKENLYYKEKIELIFSPKQAPKIELLNNLSVTYDKYFKYYQEIEPFLFLLASFQKETKECLETDTITSLIPNIKYLISKIVNQPKKADLKIKLDYFIKKYTSKINTIINEPEIPKSQYKQLYLEIRKDLQPILEELNKIVIIEQNHKNFLQQLYQATKLLKKEEIDNHEKTNVTISFIQDIINIAETSSFTIEEKEEIFSQLEKTINHYIQIIETKSSEEETNTLEKEFHQELINIKFTIENYIDQKNKYIKSYIKKK